MRPALLLAFLLVASVTAAAPRPDLVVVVSVDQLRFDYVDRFAPWFTQGGFQRFMNHGARFTNARYRHAASFTAPGHAAIGTGRSAGASGIVGNSWFERDIPPDAAMWEWYFDDNTAYLSPTNTPAPFTDTPDAWWKLGGSPRYCVYDDRVTVTAGKTSGMSPVSLANDGLGDVVKQRYPQSRVIGLAIKDRAAILMAGRGADAAYWFDSKIPGFISSSYYQHVNPAVLAFNGQIAGYFPGSNQWTPSPYIPADEMRRVTFDPPEAWPLKNNKYRGTFPHPIADAKALTYTPFAHELVLDFAMHVIATEALGTRNTPDVLFVGISPTDYLGHYYGPDSMEVADSMVRLDRDLESFLNALERRFGDRVLVVLTGDHGVTSNPEIARLRDPKADTGRVDIRTPDANAKLLSDLPPLRLAIERELARKLGVRFDAGAPLAHALVYFFEEPSLYVNWRRVAELQLEPERVKRALRDVLRGMQSHGFADAWTNTELLGPDPGASATKRLMRSSFRADRSGDVLMALRPGWIWMWGSNSTTHGQPVENDLHVPLLFWGAAVKRGVYDVDASPIDIAPTVGRVLGVTAGGNDAHVLPCVE
jgi:arylsulfatase A-like enzyme